MADLGLPPLKPLITLILPDRPLANWCAANPPRSDNPCGSETDRAIGGAFGASAFGGDISNGIGVGNGWVRAEISSSGEERGWIRRVMGVLAEEVVRRVDSNRAVEGVVGWEVRTLIIRLPRRQYVPTIILTIDYILGDWMTHLEWTWDILSSCSIDRWARGLPGP